MFLQHDHLSTPNNLNDSQEYDHLQNEQAHQIGRIQTMDVQSHGVKSPKQDQTPLTEQ